MAANKIETPQALQGGLRPVREGFRLRYTAYRGALFPAAGHDHRPARCTHNHLKMHNNDTKLETHRLPTKNAAENLPHRRMQCTPRWNLGRDWKFFEACCTPRFNLRAPASTFGGEARWEFGAADRLQVRKWQCGVRRWRIG